MNIYKLVYGSLLCGFIGLLLICLDSVKSVPKYVSYMGKCFITIGFFMMAFSIIGNRFPDGIDSKISYWWIFLGIFILLINIFTIIINDEHFI